MTKRRESHALVEFEESAARVPGKEKPLTAEVAEKDRRGRGEKQGTGFKTLPRPSGQLTGGGNRDKVGQVCRASAHRSKSVSFATSRMTSRFQSALRIVQTAALCVVLALGVT